MVPAAEMEAFVHDLLRVHRVAQRESGFYLEVTVACHQLVLDEVDQSRLVRMACYLTDGEGTDIAEPEILFYTGQDVWIPIQITRYLGGRVVYASVEAGDVTVLNDVGQQELAAYADLLAHHYRQLFLSPVATGHAPVDATVPVSTAIQDLVEQLARKHGMDLATPDACLRLRMDNGPECWVIQRVNEHISVACYHSLDDGTPDPDLIFLPTAAGWVLVDLVYSWETWRAYVLWALQHGHPICDVPRAVLFMHFATYWVRRLQELGWLAGAQPYPAA